MTLIMYVYTQDTSQKLVMFSILQCWTRQYFDRVLWYLGIYNPSLLDKKKNCLSGHTVESIYKEELAYFKLNMLNNLAQYVVQQNLKFPKKKANV